MLFICHIRNANYLDGFVEIDLICTYLMGNIWQVWCMNIYEIITTIKIMKLYITFQSFLMPLCNSSIHPVTFHLYVLPPQIPHTSPHPQSTFCHCRLIYISKTVIWVESSVCHLYFSFFFSVLLLLLSLTILKLIHVAICTNFYSISCLGSILL